MNSPQYCEQEVEFNVCGEPRRALVRTPRRLCARPALLISLAGDMRSALDGEWFDIVPNIFLAAGHRVASFDLPCHGERALQGAEGLTGMAQAVVRGEDVFADIKATATALIDRCLAVGFAEGGGILLSGTSRGGLAALHAMSADSRVLACAVFAPVTRLPVLIEFRELSDTPIVARSNAESLIPRLADRPVFTAIGTEDPRVGADDCRRFHARLLAASTRTPPVLFCAEGTSHGDTYPPGPGYQAGAAFLLRHCAEQMKKSTLIH